MCEVWRRMLGLKLSICVPWTMLGSLFNLEEKNIYSGSRIYTVNCQKCWCGRVSRCVVDVATPPRQTVTHYEIWLLRSFWSFSRLWRHRQWKGDKEIWDPKSGRLFSHMTTQTATQDLIDFLGFYLLYRGLAKEWCFTVMPYLIDFQDLISSVAVWLITTFHRDTIPD